jgi:hypothetical protein
MILLIVIILLIALLWGGWGGPRYWTSAGYYGAWGPLGLLIILLLILWLAGVVHADTLTVGASAGSLIILGLSSPVVTPSGETVDPNHDRNVIIRWWSMVAAWLLGLVAGTIGVIQKIGWDALGISDITANWLLVVAGVCVLVAGGIASFPTFPDAARLRAERTLHWDRKAAAMAKMRLTED